MQMFQELIRYADTLEESKLHIPVNVIMDDFATNTFIAGFEDIISVIRSRGISVSIILQSLSRLKGKYKEADAMTIINNCDRCIYLGANDVQLIDYISQKADRQVFISRFLKIDSNNINQIAKVANSCGIVDSKIISEMKENHERVLKKMEKTFYKFLDIY